MKYKTDKDPIFANGIVCIYKKVIIIFKFKEITEKDLTDGDDSYILDKMISLRKIKINGIEIKEFEIST